MIRWRITLDYTNEVLLNVANGDEKGVLTFRGNSTELRQIRDKFEFASGPFGHLIESADKPISGYDADHVLRSAYPDLTIVQGANIVARYNTGLNSNQIS